MKQLGKNIPKFGRQNNAGGSRIPGAEGYTNSNLSRMVDEGKSREIKTQKWSQRITLT
jgi:hypothetical protein